MNSKKVYYILLGVLVFVFIAAVGGTIYGTKTLKKTGDKLHELKLEDTVLSKDEQSLVQAKKDIEKYSELESIAKAIVPQEKDQARTVREIVSLADQSGISIKNITFPTSTLGQKPNKGSKQPTAPEGTTQLVPVTGMTGVYAMQITVDSNTDRPVTYTQLLNFLKKLENNRRTSHVTNITIKPEKGNRNLVTFSLKINAYIKL